MTTRVERLLGTADRSTRIIEIGPSHAPIAPKADGWNSYVVDHAPQEVLKAKYGSLGVRVDAIEVVDAVWNEGPIDAAVPAHLHGTFERLIASHVIEHLPDLAGFLASAQRLLRPDGVIALAVPDKRYCFDYFQPLSTTGAVIEAFLARRSRHTRQALWDHAAYAVTADGIGAWDQRPVGEVAFMGGIEDLRARWVKCTGGTEDGYEDCHVWRFTPATFSLVMFELGLIRAVDWHVDSIEGPFGCEFFAMLRRGVARDIDPSQIQSRRMELLRSQLSEQLEQLLFAAEGGVLQEEHTFARIAATVTGAVVDRLDAQEARLAEAEQAIARMRRRWAPIARVLKALRLIRAS